MCRTLLKLSVFFLKTKTGNSTIYDIQEECFKNAPTAVTFTTDRSTNPPWRTIDVLQSTFGRRHSGPSADAGQHVYAHKHRGDALARPRSITPVINN